MTIFPIVRIATNTHWTTCLINKEKHKKDDSQVIKSALSACTLYIQYHLILYAQQESI